jgi:hypothetical protein
MTDFDFLSLSLSLLGISLGLVVKTLVDTRKIQVKCASN